MAGRQGSIQKNTWRQSPPGVSREGTTQPGGATQNRQVELYPGGPPGESQKGRCQRSSDLSIVDPGPSCACHFGKRQALGWSNAYWRIPLGWNQKTIAVEEINSEGRLEWYAQIEG